MSSSWLHVNKFARNLWHSRGRWSLLSSCKSFCKHMPYLACTSIEMKVHVVLYLLQCLNCPYFLNWLLDNLERETPPPNYCFDHEITEQHKHIDSGTGHVHRLHPRCYDRCFINQAMIMCTNWKKQFPFSFSYRKAGFDHKTLFVIHDDWPVKDLGQSGHALLIGVHLETITP